MPADPSIILGVRPIEEYQARDLANRNAALANRNAATELQTNRLRLQQQQQSMADDKALRDTFANNPNATDAELISKAGRSALPVLKERYDARRAQVENQLKQLDLNQKKVEMAGSIAGGILKANTADALYRGIGDAVSNGLITDDEARELAARGWTDETRAILQQHVQSAMTATQQLAEARAQTEQKWKADEAAHKAAMAPFEEQEAIAKATTAKQAAEGTTPVTEYQRQTLKGQEEGRKIQEKRLGLEQQRVNLQSQMNQSLLSDAAEEKAAQAVARGMSVNEVVPGMGNHAAAARVRVINRAAALNPDLDMASARAGYKSDTGSLATLQKSRDQVAAFENTALKNLDQFLGTAKKVVDTNSPLANIPLRMVNEKVLGNADQTAFNVARQVAVTEVAKVLSNPGLSGQLSDAARTEVQHLIGPNATLKQIYKAADILKQDMKNRADSLDAQLGEIKGRISGKKQEQPAAAPKATHRFNPQTGKIEAIQ